jgi:hypothetical protein
MVTSLLLRPQRHLAKALYLVAGTEILQFKQLANFNLPIVEIAIDPAF